MGVLTRTYHSRYGWAIHFDGEKGRVNGYTVRTGLVDPQVAGHRETKDGPLIKGVTFVIGRKYEIFYGRRSHEIVWANTLSRSDYEQLGLPKRLSIRMTGEEIEVGFLNDIVTELENRLLDFQVYTLEECVRQSRR